MPQAGYYDYAPTVALSRPVACIGHPGCAYREVVYDLAALTGLPLHDLDHRIEHEVGQPDPCRRDDLDGDLARAKGRLRSHEGLPHQPEDAARGRWVVGAGGFVDAWKAHEAASKGPFLVLVDIDLVTIGPEEAQTKYDVGDDQDPEDSLGHRAKDSGIAGATHGFWPIANTELPKGIRTPLSIIAFSARTAA